MFDLPIRRRRPYRVILMLVAAFAIVLAISGFKLEIHYAAQKGHVFVVRALVALNVFVRPSPWLTSAARRN